MRLLVKNSYCQFLDPLPRQVHDTVFQVLTYQNDIGPEKGQLFNQLKNIKRYEKDEEKKQKRINAVLAKIKHLEANEWVHWFQNNGFPTGHLNIVRSVLDRLGFQYQIVDERKTPSNICISKWNNKPFDMRYYQKAMFDIGVREGRGVFVSAVGTGKSLVMAYLVKHFAVNSLIIVPSRGLLDQLYQDFAIWFGHQNVQCVDTKAVRKSAQLSRIRLITVQSLASLQKSGDLQKLIGDVDAVYVDEIHHAGASSYTNLLPEMDHIYYRFGFTGTFLRNDSKSLDMWGFLSNVLYRYTAKQAIEEGYLTPLKVIVYEMAGKSHKKYPKEYDNNYCGNPQMLKKIEDICFQNSGDQILNLVNRKDKSGKIIHEYLNHLNLENRYISGDNEKEEVTATIKNFNQENFEILIGSSVIGEGIDVKSTDHLIMCQGGKSEIAIVQAIGRAIRLHEGKEIAYVHDFRFKNTNYMEKHFLLREDIYNRNFGCEIIYVKNA